MNKYFEINENGHNVRCKLYYTKQQKIRRIVIFLHGFAGHKDNGACEKFANKVLEKTKGTAVIIFNWPCHGDDVKKKLCLPDCMTYLDTVIRYCRNTYHTDELYAYATSFGGYLVLRYIQEYGNPFRRIALRCPAVNMYEVLTNTIMDSDAYERIRKGKYVEVGFDRKIEVGAAFLNELKDNDIQKLDYLDYAEDILILHGTKDEVVSFDVSRAFADSNLIEFVQVENADHRFQNPACMELATKKVFEFFGF